MGDRQLQQVTKVRILLGVAGVALVVAAGCGDNLPPNTTVGPPGSTPTPTTSVEVPDGGGDASSGSPDGGVAPSDGGAAG
jgi:hypothetical protein